MSGRSKIERLRLRIIGVPCSSCIIPIRRRFEKTPGIINVGANYLLNLLLIDYDTKIVDEPVIIDALKDAGYRAVKAV